MRKIPKRPDAQHQLAVFQSFGSSTKTATRSSKRPFTFTLIRPEESSMYFPSSERELVQPALVSVLSKHSPQGGNRI